MGRKLWPLVCVVACAGLIVAPSALAYTGSVTSSTVSADPTEGKPLTFTISGVAPPGPNADGNLPWEVMMILRRASGPPCAPTLEQDQSSYWKDSNGQPTANAPVFGYIWAPGFTGSFTKTVTFAPFVGQPEFINGDIVVAWPHELRAGAYRECVWLEDASAVDASGAPAPAPLAATSSTVTLRLPHYAFTVRSPKRLRLAHYGPINNFNVKAVKRRAQTFVAQVSAEVPRNRIVGVVVEPAWVHRCPAEIWQPWRNYSNNTGDDGLWYFTKGVNGIDASGLRLHSGTGTYSYAFKISEYWEGGGKPGRALVCASVYDNTDDSPVPEAAAHTWVTVTR